MNIFKACLKKLKKSLSVGDRLEAVEENFNKSLKYEWMHQSVIHSLLTCKEKGITETSSDGEQYVISLTTHGYRLERVYQTIESLLRQMRKANKIVLYLSEEEFSGKELPITLHPQMERGLDIRYVKDIRAYTKLIPALRDFPDANIITVDDDIIYPIDLTDRLIRAHHEHPRAVCCQVAREIQMKGPETFATYTDFNHVFADTCITSPAYMALGHAGVLYPPHALHPEAFNEDVFMKICPYADDIWYKAMELMQGTAVIQLPRNPTHFMYGDPTVQTTSLMSVNIGHLKNDEQIKAVFDHYKLYDALKG